MAHGARGEPGADPAPPRTDHTPCGCCMEPVDDRIEASDLCSEATGANDGTGWRIVRCPLHAEAPNLLAALKAGAESEGWDTEQWAAWQSDAEAAIEAAS